MTFVVRRAALLIAVVAILVCGSAPLASAIENETFGVTPFPERKDGLDRTTFSIPLETGATFEDAIRVYNRTNERLNLTIYATDADTKLDDTISVGLREERATGVGAWIDMARGSVELTPRGEVTVAFRVKVRSSNPTPKLGAIVVEKAGRGLAANAAQRLHVVVRTVPPNTGTTSTRVRSLVLRSPWVFIALFGLIVAGCVVWIGARRSRRPRDIVVPPGELEAAEQDAQGASRPVIKRLGALDSSSRGGVIERVRASAGASRKRDERPLLDDAFLIEVDPDAAPEADEPDESSTEAKRPAERAESRSKRSAAARRTTGDARPRERIRQAPTRRGKPAAKRPAKTKAAAAKPRASTAKAKSAGKQAKAKAKARPSKDRTSKEQANFIPLKDL